MAIDRARAHLRALGMEDRVMEFDVSSATVELAARAVGCEPARIAKTLSFMGRDHALLVVCAGDCKIDNHKFKETFHVKARMLKADEVEKYTNHAVGGVCPFAVPEETPVYLDVSLKRFPWIYPACGSANSAIKLSNEELQALVPGARWVDVCKI